MKSGLRAFLQLGTALLALALVCLVHPTIALCQRYQSVSGDLPVALSSGARDSVLLAHTRPYINYPQKGTDALMKAVVWLRITVGEKGRVVHSEAVDCSVPGYGFEDAARDAVQEVVFAPFWNGPMSVEYAGYYPVPFLFPRQPSGQRAKASRISGIGIDAPQLDPIAPLKLSYPPKALEKAIEGRVTLRVLVTEDGTISEVWTWRVQPQNLEFEEAGKKAVKRAQFPVKVVNGRPEHYTAYTTVDFRLTAEQLQAAGFPALDAVVQLDSPPVETVGEKVMRLAYGPGAPTIGSMPIATLVDQSGRVVTARLEEFSGSSELDSAAIEFAKSKQYRPAVKDGRPSSAWVKYRLFYNSNVIYQDDAGTTHGAASSGPSAEAMAGPRIDAHPDELPRFIHFVRAVYPQAEWDRKVTGVVRLAGLIDENAKLTEVRIVESSRLAALDNAAVVAAYEHEFMAATTGGLAVRSWVSWVVDFAPDSRSVVPPSGEVAPMLQGPVIQSGEKPRYPETVRDLGLQGKVEMRMYVNAKGLIEHLEITRSSGHAELDSAAVSSARKRKYSPALKDGKPVGFWTNYSVDYSAKK